jgi:hypothetical protein
MAVRVVPWVFLASMIPSIVNGNVGMRSVVVALEASVIGLPIFFVLGLVVLSLPRSWYRR